ncbi:hypothetical protein LOAG_09855 [Loa loa]|uniref:Uncharacterized protein n=2 Tax=Loa loa TaxID=7209 RepID=A0A1S0TRL8_LOALO|nr:hypothetical protein LOAG_09855 [Loa loa]EFO18639.1 hypothetical protein LOAG_09855 [Loa loa]
MSQFNEGLDMNLGNQVTVSGNINILIFGQDIWDYKGSIKMGRLNIRIGFGSLGRPTNVLEIAPETLATLGTDIFIQRN